MRTLGAEEGWDWLVRKTRRGPLLSLSGARVERGAEGVLILPSAWHSRGGPILIGAFAVLWICISFASGALLEMGWFGGLLLLLVLYVLATRSRVWWNPLGNTVHVYRGLAGFGTHVELPAEKLTVSSGRWGETGMLDWSLKDHVILSLEHSERQGRVRLACAETQAPLTEAFKALCDFLSGRGEDETEVPVRSARGGAMTVPTAPISERGAKFATARLVVQSGVARFRPSAVLLAFGAVFAAFGLMAITMGWSLFRDEGWVGLFPGLMGLLFVAAGVGVAVFRGRSRIRAERFGHTVWLRTDRRSPVPWEELAFSDVAGVQMCRHFVPDSDGSYSSYEINLVLAGPPVRRVNLVTHGNRDVAEDDAARLAQFLEVPFWDHTDE